MLAPDVTMLSDGGGKRHAALRLNHGSNKVARLLASPAALSSAPNLRVTYRSVNGQPAAVAFSGGSPFAVVVLDIDPVSSEIREIYTISNPDKIRRIDPAGPQH